MSDWLQQLKAEIWAQGYADGQDSIYTAVDEWPNPAIRSPYLESENMLNGPESDEKDARLSTKGDTK